MSNAIEYASFAHIAPGPYRLIGVETEDMRAERYSHEMATIDYCVHTDNMCGGTCEHCGTPIFDVYTFRASNGVKFKVGCDCAEKALGSTDDSSALASFQAAKRKVDSKKRKALANRKDAAAREWLIANMTALESKPSPNERRAEIGETAADWAQWMMANAGKAGVQKTVKTAKLLLSA